MDSMAPGREIPSPVMRLKSRKDPELPHQVVVHKPEDP